MDFFTFVICALIVVFFLILVAGGLATMIAASPFILALFVLWLLIFHTIAGLIVAVVLVVLVTAVKAGK